MFWLSRNGWEPIMIYGIDAERNKFLIYEHDEWTWVPMSEFKPMFS